MKTLTTACVLSCALFAPAASLAAKPADAGSKSAAKECRAERNAMGAENFATLYGSNKNRKNAFGKCVSKTVKEQRAEATAAKTNAAKECKAEEAADPAAFAAKYGTNKNDKNAFGKCVSGKAKELQAEEDAKDADELNAARTCRAEQEADPAAFKAAHGTNANGKNAFGRCVSELARADS